MDLEKNKNSCENLIQQALNNLQNADDIMLDILQLENTIEHKILSEKIFRCILIIKDILDI